MAQHTDGETLRKMLLEAVDRAFQMRPNGVDADSILRDVFQQLGWKGPIETQQAVLTLFYDLFRTGHLSYGMDLNNPGPPWCHVTDQGRKALANLSRDPANPDGYLAHLRASATPNAVADSYVEEALRTYNANCFRATAVMIGAAAESLVLEVREALADRMKSLQKMPPKALMHWQIKRVLDALRAELETCKGEMPPRLAEQVECYWPAFTQQIRAARNQAGHPTTLDPVTHETVHASLLIFPELARLALDLKSWILNSYS